MQRPSTLRVSFTVGLLAALGLVAVACSATVNGGPGTNPGGATPAQISQCQTSCDQMKFFGCNSADEHAACYADCNTATAAQIAQFNGCAMSSVCDPACRTDISPPAPGGGKPAGTGASASTCASACTKLAMCSIIMVGQQDACVSQCQTSAYQYQIDCVNNTACASILSACGGSSSGGGPIDAGTGVDVVVPPYDAGNPNIIPCQNACDILFSMSCIMASDQSTCRSLCASSTSAKDQTFYTCAQAAPDCTSGTACYTTFMMP